MGEGGGGLRSMGWLRGTFNGGTRPSGKSNTAVRLETRSMGAICAHASRVDTQGVPNKAPV